jgi:hypothetical protein
MGKFGLKGVGMGWRGEGYDGREGKLGVSQMGFILSSDEIG